MGIDLHIEELVLHGFAARDRHRIAAAVQQELSRLIANGGKANQVPLTLDRVDGGAFRVQAGAIPQAAGTQIARAVYRAVDRTRRQPARVAAIASRSQPGGRQA